MVALLHRREQANCLDASTQSARAGISPSRGRAQSRFVRLARRASAASRDRGGRPRVVPDLLIIGFARRNATYGRLGLLGDSGFSFTTPVRSYCSPGAVPEPLEPAGGVARPEHDRLRPVHLRPVSLVRQAGGHGARHHRRPLGRPRDSCPNAAARRPARSPPRSSRPPGWSFRCRSARSSHMSLSSPQTTGVSTPNPGGQASITSVSCQITGRSS